MVGAIAEIHTLELVLPTKRTSFPSTWGMLTLPSPSRLAILAWIALVMPVTASAGGGPPIGSAAMEAVAIVTTEAIVVDGHLDERTWELAPKITEFVVPLV